MLNPVIRHTLNPRYWPSALGLLLLRLLVFLPYRCQMAVGAAIGWLSYYLCARRRHIAKVNLTLCFPKLSKKKINQLNRRSFIAVGKGLIEMGLAWWQNDAFIQSKVSMKGREHLDEALQQKRAVILVGAHYSTLDLAGRALAADYPICASYRPSKNKLVDTIMCRARQRLYTAVLERNQTRLFIRCLRNKQFLWYAPDQDYGRKVSVFAPFLGVPAATITTTARLAQLGDALVIPMVQYRLENNQGYVIEFSPPLTDYPSGDAVSDASRINAIIGASILKRPEQYLWQHRRFKTQPPGKNRPY